MKPSLPLLLFTDGACSGNPGPGGWAFVAAFPDGRVMERAGRAEHTTNNRMEMTAALEAFAVVRTVPGTAILHTDSTYLMDGMTSWLKNWKRRGWKTAEGHPVKNEDLWRALDQAVTERGPGGLEWRWVRGHDGHEINERCDQLAVAMSQGQPVSLYAGLISSYPHGSLSCAPILPRSGGSLAYLSLLDGRLERHVSWKECQARVQGRSGARFKKVRSEAEESAVRRAWGLD